ncbi:MAG TPA: hypothetical protein VGK67_18860 [Myxococcales bacterium]|jgi:hypothetical protein
MTNTARALLVASALLASASGSARAAGWEKYSGGADPTVLVSLSVPDPAHLFAAGLLMDGSAFPPKVSPRVLSSTDGGRTWTDVSSNLASLAFTTLNAVAFVDANRGWVAGGKKVWSTVNAGAAWVPATSDAGFEVQALHFFDVKNGVAVGGDANDTAVVIKRTADGGKTWTAATVPAVEGTAYSTFWLSDKVGWAAGQSKQTIDEGNGQTYDAPKEGFTLATADGGATWTVSDTRVAGYGLGPAFFLRDGKTGWVAGYKMTDAIRSEAALYKSTDGGKTWVDAKIPLDVATMSMMGQAAKINTSFFQTLFFASEKSGHLGGTVYLSDSDDGSGQTVHVYKVVDYWTEDGATWQRTNLGTISLTTPVTNDGTLVAGQMLGLGQGWMVGDKAMVWGYNADPPVPCKVEGDCAPGFGCSVFGKCQPVTCPDGCPEGQVCSWQVCRTPPDAGTPAGSDGSVPVQYDDAGNPVVVPGSDGGTPLGGDDGGGPAAKVDSGASAGGGETGCGCGAGAGAMPALAGLGALLWALGVTRRPRIR